jgi:tRNA (mo5U34)-methyltransferase
VRAAGTPDPGLRERVEGVGFWWHSIDLGAGVVTPGAKSSADHASELERMALPDLAGRTVLDIGGWDGFYAFEAERRGAARAAVLDHYTWSLDLVPLYEYGRRAAAAGETPTPSHLTEWWRPRELPGKRGFDLAREVLGSRVEGIVCDFAECDPERVGTWDVVLYLGVLYHMEDPMRCLRRLAAVTGEIAVLETAAVVVVGAEDRALWRFFGQDEPLGGDPTNWWAPSAAGLLAALVRAGFASAEVVSGPPAGLGGAPGDEHVYRLFVHARK